MDEGRNEEGKLQLDGTSHLDPILDLPETSPAGTDQVVWRDNEKIGDRRETHQEKAPIGHVHHLILRRMSGMSTK